MTTSRIPGPFTSASPAFLLGRAQGVLATAQWPGPVGAQAGAHQASAGGGGASEIDADRVLRVLRALNEGFEFESRYLRLVKARDQGVPPANRRIEVLATDDAAGILGRFEASGKVSEQEHSALVQAISLLPEPGVEPGPGNLQLVWLAPLGRPEPRPAPKPAPAPPAPGRRVPPVVRETHWIEIELVDDQGAPVPGAQYLIVAPDRGRYTGVTDQRGIARVDGIVSGECRVTFTRLDRSAVRPA